MDGIFESFLPERRETNGEKLRVPLRLYKLVSAYKWTVEERGKWIWFSDLSLSLSLSLTQTHTHTVLEGEGVCVRLLTLSAALKRPAHALLEGSTWVCICNMTN